MFLFLNIIKLLFGRASNRNHILRRILSFLYALAWVRFLAHDFFVLKLREMNPPIFF